MYEAKPGDVSPGFLVPTIFVKLHSGSLLDIRHPLHTPVSVLHSYFSPFVWIKMVWGRGQWYIVVHKWYEVVG
jgi:hypothetical protein